MYCISKFKVINDIRTIWYCLFRLKFTRLFCAFLQSLILKKLQEPRYNNFVNDWMLN